MNLKIIYCWGWFECGPMRTPDVFLNAANDWPVQCTLLWHHRLTPSTVFTPTRPNLKYRIRPKHPQNVCLCGRTSGRKKRVETRKGPLKTHWHIKRLFHPPSSDDPCFILLLLAPALGCCSHHPHLLQIQDLSESILFVDNLLACNTYLRP